MEAFAAEVANGGPQEADGESLFIKKALGRRIGLWDAQKRWLSFVWQAINLGGV